MTDLQKKIIEFLTKTPEATAKKIADGINENQGSVINAMNALRTDAVVECEKRNEQGPGLIYWLAKPAAVEPPKPKVNAKSTRGALDIAVDNHNIISAICEAVDFGDRKIKDLPEFVKTKLSEVNAAEDDRTLQGRLEEWREENMRLNAALKTAESQRDAWRNCIGNISGEDTPINAARHFDEINGELIRLRAENVSLKTLNEAMPGFGAAHEEIKTMRRPSTGSTGIDGAISAKAGKITLFFDRRLNARSVTLQKERLSKLIALV